MTTYAYPNTVAFQVESAEWRLEDSVLISNSPLTGSIKTKEIPGARWVVTIGYSAAMTDAERAEVEGWWASAGQRKHDLTLWHQKRPEPRGTIKGVASGTVVGAWSQGASALVISVGVPHAGKTLLTGDLFGLAGRVRMVRADAVVDGSGNIGPGFEPPLEAAVSNGAAINFVRPTSRFLHNAAGVAVPWRGDRGGPAFSVPLVEL